MQATDQSEHWEQVQLLFDELTELEPEARARRLEEVRGNDPALHAAAVSLLKAFDDAGDFMGLLTDPDERLGRQPHHAPAPASLREGVKIHAYRIVRALGRGGMGEVYLAHDQRLGRLVALKFLSPHLSTSEEACERLYTEARAAAALDHPNIATVFEIGEDEAGAVFIAMAYYPGRTLKERIAEGPLPVDEALDIATQVASGLAAAHHKGIIHRDVKPANILLSDGGPVKILDFGLAKRAGQDLTQDNRTMGTVAYMSPEQIRGEAVDHRADLWSLGVVFYELFTGQRPFGGEHPQAVIYAILNEEPESVRALGPEVPGAVAQVVERLLRKDPEERYEDMDALLADLRTIQRGGSPTTQRAVYGSRGQRAWIGSTAILVLLLALGLGFYLLQTNQHPEGAAASTSLEERPMIVVLPLENLGSADQAYFAAGMTEELTSRLAAVSALGVIARSSARQYAGTDKPLQQIGEELGVEYVLEGTVRWAAADGGPGRVRITPHLSRVSDGTEIWSETYEREMADVFAVQAEIAQAVVEQLGVRLREREAVEERPTENLEAYHAYLRGQFHASGRFDFLSKENWEEAIAHFERAVALDPTFALAYAELTEAHSRMIRRGYDVSEERHRRAREALEQALALAPEAPEVQLALGQYHYFARMDYEQAFAAFERAGQGMPGNSEPLAYKGWILLRQGDWEQGLAALEEARQLNPWDPRRSQALGENLLRVRRYQEAAAYHDRAIALAPDEYSGYLDKAQTYWTWRGDVKAARAALEAVPAHLSSQRDVVSAWFWQELYEGNYRAALGRLSALDTAFYSLWQAPRPLLEAFAYDLLDEPEQARRAYEAARILLEQELEGHPKDYRRYPVLRGALGLAYAGLGRREEAMREGEEAVAFLPVSKDEADGVFRLQDLALIYTMVGEYDAALDQIERLLSMPSSLSVPLLQLDPRWAPLRSHPQFQTLLQKAMER